MKLRKLSIRRMPGFTARGFELDDLSAGLNVICGPNASGKTTACRAVRGLLWPETLQGVSPVSLAAEWSEGGRDLRLQLEGTALSCEADGLPADCPVLPAPHLAGCFTVSVGDLYEDTRTDSSLAASVAREMAGGYDLRALRSLEAFRVSRNAGRTEARDLEEQRREANRVRDEQQALRHEESELAELEEQERHAALAEARQATLRERRELFEVAARMTETRSLLGALPEAMERVRGDERQRLRQIRDDLQQTEAELAEASEAEREARQALAELPLPAEGAGELDLQEQRARLEELRVVEQRCQDCTAREQEAGARAAEARRPFGAAATPEQLDALEPADLDGVETLHREWEDNRARRGALEARLELLADAEPPHKVEVLTAAISLLRQWFEAGTAPVESDRRLRALMWMLIGLTAAVAGALALLVNVLWLLLLLPAGLASAAALGARTAPPDRRRPLQEQYERLPLAAPEAWERESVGRRLNALEEELAAARRAEQEGAERKSVELQLTQVTEQAAALEQQQQALAARLGVPVDSSSLTLTILAMNLVRYREAREAQANCAVAGESLQKQREALLRGLNVHLARFGLGPCDTSSLARAHSEQVEKRVARHAEAARQLTAADAKREAAQARLSELAARKRDLFAELGLADDEDLGLARRLEALDEYKRLSTDLQALRAAEQALLTRLEGAPEVLALTPEEVAAEDERLQALVAGREQLLDRIVDIRSRVAATARGSRLEDALAQVDEARASLTARRDETAFAAAGAFLIDEVQAEYEVKSQPAVLRRASQWLGSFTRGRYELKLDNNQGADGPAFRGFDTRERTGLALAQLSGGTRMQLLLAVRLAFAAAAEREMPLPFVLDEVLSNSDPVRCRAIIQAVLAMVQEGRQVLYFTCQPGDAEAWEQLAAEAGLEGVRRIELAGLPSAERVTADLLAGSTAAAPPVPPPGALTLEEYMVALGVPALEPARGAAAAHVAHLVAAPGDLQRLAQAGIDTYGQLQSLASQGSIEGYLSEDTVQRMRARAQALDAFAAAWAVGRGPQLSREVLLAAGVSDSFIDRISSLAADLDWDARRLIEALQDRSDERTKGFRANALETVTESLTASGHLPTEEPLGREQLQARVLSALNEPLRRGLIEVEEVHGLFVQLWHRASAAG